MDVDVSVSLTIPYVLLLSSFFSMVFSFYQFWDICGYSFCLSFLFKSLFLLGLFVESILFV